MNGRQAPKLTAPSGGPPRTGCAAFRPPLHVERSALLPKGEFNPTLHIQCQYAVMPVVDDLPHYKGFPPQFGGTSDLVDW